MNIYIGNLSFEATEETLSKLFEPYGIVTSVKIIRDKFTAKSRGFGFVEMEDEDKATMAIAALSGKELLGRTLTVNRARQKRF